MGVQAGALRAGLRAHEVTYNVEPFSSTKNGAYVSSAQFTKW